ncbi:hypothetical protein PVAP13_9KG107500 [Panicum virgatum]|nr:hypothetical protein PVAP13_9KG107500 [Panicum virgatum]KAG2549421.1 hypothetical protein PVAP13_9KG107500 [Panicum virgatum]KAG2549423.1 hypothetical protein PVAP13_9KG107500 [Panicum virgatum]
MLFYHMVFVNTCTSVWPYFYCLALLLASNHVFHLHKGMFCTMKDMSDLLKGVPRNTHQKPRQGNAMEAFCLVGLLAVTLVCVVVITFGQQSYNWPYIEDNLFKLSCSVKIAVVLWPVIDRCGSLRMTQEMFCGQRWLVHLQLLFVQVLRYFHVPKEECGLTMRAAAIWFLISWEWLQASVKLSAG